MDTSLEVQLQQHLDVLNRTIQEKKLSIPKVEAKLGWERGTLLAKFRDPMVLLYGEIFQILEALGVEPGEYFMNVACRLRSCSPPFPGSEVSFLEEVWRRLKMVEEKLTKLEEM